MVEKDRILDIIYQAVDDVNRQLPSDSQLPAASDTALIGSGSPLDSLGLINLMVAVEGLLTQELSLTVSLTDSLTARDESGFGTIGEMAEFIVQQAGSDG